MNDEYLGDGVYASYDGYHIVLDLRGQTGLEGAGEVFRIALEPSVFAALTRYSDRVNEAHMKQKEKNL